MNKKRKGVFLVELVVAVLVAASTSMAIFSVILSSSVSQKRAEKKQRAAMVFKRAQESLKSYVTVETGGTFFTTTPGQGWRLPGDSLSWGLTAGVHDITSWISSDVVLCPQGGSPSCRFTYTVTNEGSCSPFGIADNLACKRVRFDLRYSD
ncbi:MAG: hypothetical protein HY746_01640 [Elusimicrobia bacterium]|nr:hypothetical protein [Elusimicrobiota bacterium]